MADEQEHPLILWAQNQPRWQQHALKFLTKHGSAHAIPEEDKKEIKRILTAEAKGEEPDFTLISVSDVPVSSLDWDRRALIAERLAEEAKKRQVIIFTHDFSCALQLEKSEKDKNRGNSNPFFQQLWIAKQSMGTELQFGVTGETAAAWESKRFNQRLQVISSKISELGKSDLVSDGSGTSDFERRASDIARQLRQTWERAVEEIALNETIRRLSPNVMTTKLEQVQFDCATDYQTLHEGMSAISTPAHDNPEHGGNAAPTLEQLKQSKTLLEGWIENFRHKRQVLDDGGHGGSRA